MFPARAGMNRLVPLIGRALPNVPRTRGDEPAEDGGEELIKECSPHARG